MENQVVEVKNEIQPDAVNGQLEALGGLFSKEEMQKITQTVKPTEPTTPPTEPTTPAAEPPKVEPTTPATPPKTDAELEKLKNTSFFGDIEVPAATTPVEIKDWENATKFITTETGIEVKDFSDIQKLVTEYKTSKEKMAVLPEMENKTRFYEDLYTSLPDDLFEDIQLARQGGDYRSRQKERLSKEMIDLNIPFKKQDTKEILNYFYPGKFSDEDYEDSDNPKVAFALGEAESKFNALKESKATTENSYRETFEKKEQIARERLKQTAVASYNQLNANLDNQKKSDINKYLENPRLIQEIFFDKDGGYKPEAAKKLHLLLHAEEEIALAKQFIKNRTLSQVNEAVSAHMNDRPNTAGSGTPTTSKDNQKQAEEYVNNLLT